MPPDSKVPIESRRVNVVVTEAGRCPLLQAGDSFTVLDNEVTHSKGKVCMRSLYALYPQINACIEAAPPKHASSHGPLRCSRGSCGATFRAEVLAAGDVAVPVTKLPDAARSSVRRAVLAGAMFQNLGCFMERLPAELSSQLMRGSIVQAYTSGDVILAEGQKNDKLFIVGDGEVVLSRRFPLDNQDTFLAVLGVGECFGELSLLSEQINQITVRAHPHATIYTITKDHVAQFVYTQPIFTLALCEMLSDRLRVFLATIGEDVRPGMRGDLATIPVVDLVQALNGSRRNGTLVLVDGQREGRLVFEQGRLVDVSLSGEHGEEHFYAMAGWKKGYFRFETDVPEVADAVRIRKETLSLLMEHARREDEAGWVHTSGEYDRQKLQSETQRRVKEQGKT